VIRRIRPEEWRQLRALRLRALADAPFAFARSREEEARRPEEEWRSAARTPIFVAIRDGEWVGMAGCFLEETEAGAVVWGMWVAPEARRAGLGRRLLEAALDWARSEGGRWARLSVTETNVEAAELYRGAGFTATGKSKPLASDPSLTEVELERPL
jgi:ribosomal protein S18 acetylase RimI-like enzyme